MEDLDEVEHAVEAEFLRPVPLGESSYRSACFARSKASCPWATRARCSDAEAVARHGKTGLAGWMSQAEALWNEHGVSDMKLVERWNYHNELGAQFPIAPVRIVYAKAGTLPAAAIVQDARAVIDHMLYWAAVTDRREGLYLASILGSETTRKKVETLQARGQWGARHFDKVTFTLPIPRFEANNGLHTDLAAAGAEAENLAAKVELADGIDFQTARRRVREALAEAGISERIDALVARLLG